MTVDQVLQFIASLAEAARVAVQNGESEVSLTDSVRAADYRASGELADAIRSAKVAASDGSE